MNFPPPGVGCDSGRATPSLRHTQHPVPPNKRNPAERHLSFAGNCSDNRSQLYETHLVLPPAPVSVIIFAWSLIHLFQSPLIFSSATFLFSGSVFHQFARGTV